MGVQGCSILTHWHSRTLNSIRADVQYSLTGIQAHSQAFGVCSVLTQLRSFSWSHHRKLHSIMAQWQLCALIGCSNSLNGGQVHSMGVQGHSILTHWHSCACSGCSGAVQYSLIGSHSHSQAISCVQYSLKGIQLVQALEGSIDMFSNMQSTLRLYKFGLNFC
jgi:hypothetical protein